MTATLAPIPLGRVVMTRGVAELVRQRPVMAESILAWLRRHAVNDCPNLSDDDRRANALAMRDGDRVLTWWHGLSATGAPKLYIITEWDRSATTVLLADEY